MEERGFVMNTVVIVLWDNLKSQAVTLRAVSAFPVDDYVRGIRVHFPDATTQFFPFHSIHAVMQ